mgnify:FL=1
MTNEELNTALYKKMFAEQDKFRDWLKSQPAAEVLNHTYEYTVREDILISLEYNDLTDAQALALLASPSPLADIYQEFDRMESSHMEAIWSCIESRADAKQVSQLDQAKQLINEFCMSEYDAPADFDDLSRIDVAYTTVGNDGYPLQVYVDLKEYKIERELEERPLDVRQYSSLEELIENELKGMDFQELVAVTEAEIQTALAAAEEKVALSDLPVYRENFDYARECREVETYRISLQANIACKEAIEQAISQSYDGRRLAEGTASKVMNQFGAERVLYVLANTIQQKEWDGRFTYPNKEWAKTVSIPPNMDSFGMDRNYAFAVSSHPGLIDLFVTQARKEMERQPRTSGREQLRQAQKETGKKAPATHKKKEPER